MQLIALIFQDDKRDKNKEDKKSHIFFAFIIKYNEYDIKQPLWLSNKL